MSRRNACRLFGLGHPAWVTCQAVTENRGPTWSPQHAENTWLVLSKCSGCSGGCRAPRLHLLCVLPAAPVPSSKLHMVWDMWTAGNPS